MVTYKVLLDTRRPKSDGTYSVIIRTTFNRKSSTINTGIFIYQEFWDETKSNVKAAHPNHKLLNKKITECYLKVQKGVIEIESTSEFNLETLKEQLNSKNKTPLPSSNTSFNHFASQVIADMFAINKAGNAVIYQTATNRLMAYANKPLLKFTEITYSFLDGFKTHLIKGGMKQNTISNYFRTLRAIYNRAIKAKLVDRSHYPFLDITIKTERTAKRALQVADLIRVATVALKPRTPMWHARNYFLLSFTLIGMSFTDIAHLKPGNIRKGRLMYNRKKTGKELNIKLQPYTLKLFQYYVGTDTGYLLPVIPKGTIEGSKRAKVIINQWIKTTNKYLDRIAEFCGIDAEITSYVARHSWATTAKRLGYSIEMIAEAMGHEYGNKITNIYLDNFYQYLIDDMNDQVIISVIPCLKQTTNLYRFTLRPSLDLANYKMQLTTLSFIRNAKL